MVRNNITKSLARLTRPIRQLLDRKQLARLTRIPRTILTKGGVGERLIELENRLDRLQRGWNQHIPSLLDSMSDALDAAHHAEDGHRRVDAVREDLDRLASRLELHLTELQSAQRDRSPAHRDLTGVTFAMADGRGVIISPSARDLPVAPRSIQMITVDMGFEVARFGEGLDEMLAEWFDLLGPNGSIHIYRCRPIEVLEAADSNDIDFAALRQAVSAGLVVSPEFPTDNQLIRAFDACGFEVGESVLGSDGLVRTLVARRPLDLRP